MQQYFSAEVCIQKAELGLTAPIQMQLLPGAAVNIPAPSAERRTITLPLWLSHMAQQLSQAPPCISPLCYWVQLKVPMAGSKAGKGPPCLGGVRRHRKEQCGQAAVFLTLRPFSWLSGSESWFDSLMGDWVEGERQGGAVSQLHLLRALTSACRGRRVLIPLSR